MVVASEGKEDNPYTHTHTQIHTLPPQGSAIYLMVQKTPGPLSASISRSCNSAKMLAVLQLVPRERLKVYINRQQKRGRGEVESLCSSQ